MAYGTDFLSAGAGGYGTDFLLDTTPQVRISLPGPLGLPAMVGANTAARSSVATPLAAPRVFIASSQADARIAVPTILGAPATFAILPVDAAVSVPTPLGLPAALAVLGVDVTISVPGPLAAPSITAETPLVAHLSTPSPLRAPTVQVDVSAIVIASTPSPLRLPRAFAINDWTKLVPLDAQIYYACELQAPGERLRLPISSWQATIQSDRQSYLQAVVPGALAFVEQISALENPELVIFRGAREADGLERELEMARVPVGRADLARGPGRITYTISGYGDIQFEIPGEPTPGTTRQLTGVRTVNAGAGVRVRADIDWLLRPGMTAMGGGQEFTARWINYYVNVDNAFMDVGERAL